MKKTVVILGCLVAMGVSSVSCSRDETYQPQTAVKPVTNTIPTVAITSIAGENNQVDNTEKAGTVDVKGKVTGDFKKDDEVIVTVNNEEIKGKLDDKGEFSISIEAKKLVEATTKKVKAVVKATLADNTKKEVSIEKEYTVQELEKLSFYTSSGRSIEVVLTANGSTIDLEGTKKLHNGNFITGDAALDAMIKTAKQEDLQGRVEVKAITTDGKLLFVKKRDNSTATFRSSTSLLNADAFKGSTAKRVTIYPLDANKYDLEKAVAPSWVDTKKAPTRYHEVENPAGYTLFNGDGWFFAPKK